MWQKMVIDRRFCFGLWNTQIDGESTLWRPTQATAEARRGLVRLFPTAYQSIRTYLAQHKVDGLRVGVPSWR